MLSSRALTPFKSCLNQPGGHMPDKYCSNCGQGLSIQDNFCRRCGTVSTTNASDLPNTPTSVGNQGTPATSGPAPQESQPRAIPNRIRSNSGRAIRCPHCDTRNQVGTNRCTNCGTVLQPSSDNRPTQAAMSPDAPRGINIGGMSRAERKCTSGAEQNCTTERRNVSSKVRGV
jgi:hypothetical protein